ncbi:hypothetical protein LTR86_010877 [Recurvomyces mirabilis]|nr:hypothetical protein LTR86_010877 [Recurvomyces mirabilis]
MAQPSNPFMRQLTSSDRKTRLSALSSLRIYLSSRPATQPFTPLDLQKLHKALFYALWMQDKPLHQQNLSKDLASLVDELKGQENTVIWFDAFWSTISREWSGIDALRMDKFLFLVRCFLAKTFEICVQKDWQGEVVEGLLKGLEKTPLSARDGKVPDGLRYHVIDIYVDELDKADTKREVLLNEALAPLRKLGEETLSKVVRKRVKEALQEERISDWKGKKAEQENEDADMDGSDNEDFGGFDD